MQPHALQRGQRLRGVHIVRRSEAVAADLADRDAEQQLACARVAMQLAHAREECALE